MEEILSQYPLLYFMTTIILSVPQSICVYGALHRRTFLGFLFGLGSIFILFYASLYIPALQPENTQYLIQDDWVAFQFILFVVVSVISVVSLSISAPLFRLVLSKFSQNRQINSNWRSFIVALFPVPAVALLTLFLASSIYFPSEFDLLEVVFSLPVNSDTLLLGGMAIVSVVSAQMCTIMFALGIYTLLPRK